MNGDPLTRTLESEIWAGVGGLMHDCLESSNNRIQDVKRSTLLPSGRLTLRLLRRRYIDRSIVLLISTT